MMTRREFGLALAGTAAGLGRRASEAAPLTTVATPVAASAPVLGTVAAGELGQRIRLSADRLTRGGVPAYTRDMVLADVTLDRRRRFTEWSGDLSGRYLEALAVLPASRPVDLRTLTREILRHQHEDGRFGDAALQYASEAIGKPHMALLWGNGRLLLGLLQYHAASKDEEVLRAAQRLGDFLVGVRKQCADPAVAKRLEGQGAFGIVCFTQLIEPLALLSRATGDGRYREVGREIAPLLGPRGVQHAHGYLTTLRGMVLLSQETGNDGLLAVAEKLYRDLASSPDLCAFGGVLEYFGAAEPGGGRETRDEGCAVADFLRLSLQLFHATGKDEYFDRAERCLRNHFAFNQFASGDFGHHVFSPAGIRPTDNVGRAWWCCTMHGYRAFRDVLDAAVTAQGALVRVHLLDDLDWSGATLAFGLRHRSLGPFHSRLVLEVKRAGLKPVELAIRRPAWAQSAKLFVNGLPQTVSAEEGYVSVQRVFRVGDRVELALRHKVVVETRDGRKLAPTEVGEETEGVLSVGPWLYAVDDGQEPLFFSEPWMGENAVELPKPAVAPPLPAAAPAKPIDVPPLSNPARYITTRYRHGGFAGTNPLRLRPIAEQTGREPGALAAWLRWRTTA